MFGQYEYSNKIDSLFAEWDHPNTPGCALGIIQDGKLVYARGYGLANMEYDIPISDSSVFRIASTSKQFTAACIVLLVEQGKLKLDNTLDQYFPDFPDYAEKITIRHLLNHTSGIRDYLTIAYLKGLKDDDYYEDSDIMQWLTSQRDLNFMPGEEYTYSNSGYWLLGQIVNQVSGKNMAEFAYEKIFKPLGMENTHFHNDHKMIVKNRASGYYPDGLFSYQISMTTLNMIGDGGIFTTIQDIKKWDDAYYQSDVLSQEFWSMMTTQGKLNNGEEIDYASGLFLKDYKGLPTISHGGAFVGFRAELVRFPEQKVSIAVFANRGDANPTAKAFRVADIILADQLDVESPKKETEVSAVSEYVEPSEIYTSAQIEGSYEIEPGVVITMTSKNDTINVRQEWNGSQYYILKTRGNTYQIPEMATLSFTFSELNDGSCEVLTILQDGRTTVCKRKDKVNLDDIQLDQYVGEYYSPELDETYHVSLVDDALMVSVRSQKIGISPSDTDMFSYQGNSIRFVRRRGEISGFELDAGRVKNLKFEKKD